MATAKTYANLDSFSGTLHSYEAKRYHNTGPISLKPDWAYSSASGRGKWVRFGIHYGGSQYGDSLQWDNGEQSDTKTFMRQTGGIPPITTTYPAGTIGLLGRTFATGYQAHDVLHVNLVLTY